MLTITANLDPSSLGLDLSDGRYSKYLLPGYVGEDTLTCDFVIANENSDIMRNINVMVPLDSVEGLI